jgi:hypothetical protein
MDHNHGGGGSSGGATGTATFQTTNMAIARTYWYLIAGVMGGFLCARCVNYYQTWTRCVATNGDMFSALTPC